MYTDCEGIILKQIKIAGERRMLVLLTDKFGKISAGTSMPERGKNRSSLALRPFTRGRYELYRNKDSFSINSAQVLKSFYAIGEDVDKYLAACCVLELTDRLLPECDPAADMYKLLCAFLSLLEKRPKDFDTPVIAFQIKALLISGFSLSQNTLIEKESNDTINVINYIEKHPLASLERISVSSGPAVRIKLIIKKVLAENLGIDHLKSESVQIIEKGV